MNKKRIVLTSIIGMAAIATLSVSLTWAWYASSDHLQVDSFDIDMNGNVQLLLSTSKELDTFKQKLTNEDLVKEENFALAPVSSMYKDEWFAEKASDPLFYDCSTAVSEEGTLIKEVARSGYFSKKIYLLSNTVDYYATLDASQCAFNANETANFLRAQDMHNQYKDATVEQIAESLNSLKGCLRMSILVNSEDYYRYYIIDPYKQENEQVLFGGTLDNDADGYYDYYVENGQKREYIYGEVENRDDARYIDPVDPHGIVDRIDSRGNFYGNSFIAKNRIDTYTFDKENSTDLRIASEDSYALSDADDINTEILIPCHPNEPTEITVSIYLEGWDKACVNQTMGACFDTNISFKLLRRIL